MVGLDRTYVTEFEQAWWWIRSVHPAGAGDIAWTGMTPYLTFSDPELGLDIIPVIII